MQGFNCNRFTGKHVVVTAATAGIGFAIAERLASEGAKVSLCSRKQENVDAALEKLRGKQLEVDGCTCNVSDPSHVRSFIARATEKHGNIDALVLNAAVNPFAGPLLETPDWAIDKILQVNVKAALQVIQAAAPYLAEGAAVVLISSYTAYSPPAPIAMYAVSKTALLGLTAGLAAEMGPRVRVNCVAPGIVPTRFSEVLINTVDKVDELKKATFLKRLGKPEEIAAAVAFFASDDASYVTGETMMVAGGVTSRL